MKTGNVKFSKNTCFLLQTLCLKASCLGESSLPLEEVKLVSGRKLEIGVLEIDNKRGKSIHQEAFGSRGCWVQWRDLENGQMLWGHICEESLDHKSPIFPGINGSAAQILYLRCM